MALGLLAFISVVPMLQLLHICTYVCVHVLLMCVHMYVSVCTCMDACMHTPLCIVLSELNITQIVDFVCNGV